MADASFLIRNIRQDDAHGYQKILRLRVDELRKQKKMDWLELHNAFWDVLPPTERGAGDAITKANDRKSFYRAFKSGQGAPNNSYPPHRVYLLAEFFGVELGELLRPFIASHAPWSTEVVGQPRYTAALLEAGEQSDSPRYHIAGAHITFAVLPEVAVRRVYRAMYPNNPAAVEQFIRLAGHVRHQYSVTLKDKRQLPQITNYIPASSFDRLFTECPAEEVGEMQQFLCYLRNLIAGKDKFEVLLISDKVLGDTDTRLVAANGLASERTFGSGQIDWSTDEAQVCHALDWFNNIGKGEKLEAKKIDELCRLLDTKK